MVATSAQMKHLKSVFSETNEPFKNTYWIVPCMDSIKKYFFCVDQKKGTIAGHSFNIGPYIGK
jgi:hypothetical protein